MSKELKMCIRWLVFIGILVTCYIMANPSKEQGKGDVEVICMGTVEDADCMLVFQEGAAVMIDTGTEQDAAHILEVMEENKIKRLDYLILSHGDADHIGGAKQIAEKIPIGFVIECGNERNREEIQELNACLDELGIPVLYPVHTQQFRAGEMRMLVYPPLEKRYNDSNNASLAVLIQHGEVNMMFAGDAMRKRSEELLFIDWPEIDLYKIPHHARGNSKTGELFDKIAPTYAVATAGTADESVLEAAERNQTQIFYTGKGDCSFVSDKKTLQAK